MRFSKFAFSFMAAMVLAACTNTWDGVKKDYADTHGWAHRKSNTRLERSIGLAPTGYYGQNRRGVVLKPTGLETGGADVAMGSQLNWRQIDGYYDQTDNMAPIGSTEIGPEAVNYGEDVTVYPVDGAPVAVASAPETPAFTGTYGRLVQKIYFPHGSSQIKQMDRKSLKQFAGGVGTTDVAVTVVGHASARVDGVTDPVRRKMINFEMAQKRANAVTRELKKAGLNPGWVQAVSKGDEEPNDDTVGKDQESADRRVELFVNDR
jgi:outer membrane protein OmpA-like peptidoglycan-associated protein